MANDIKRAAGVILKEPDGKVLLCERADGEGWAFPAGHVEAGETAEQAARRELCEETAYLHEGELKPWCRRVKDGVDFTTFVGAVPQEFVPVLNDEHTQHEWVRPEDAVRPSTEPERKLHPGAHAALKLVGANELEVARMMRDGELTGPHRYGNFLLIALRVTGTGAAYRPKINEFVWRDPSLYLNDDFLERCQGLPVLERHPSTKLLDSAEYARLSVGTVMLPYIVGDEVWGIAKVYDARTIEELEAERLSTSPGVNTSGTKIKLSGGKHILIEDDPQLLDHVAICEDGVWDKGGPPAGVGVPEDVGAHAATTPIGDSTMAEVSEGGAPAEPAAGGEEMTDSKRLDAILGHVQRLHSRHDDLEARLTKLEGKREAGEPVAGSEGGEKPAAAEGSPGEAAAVAAGEKEPVPAEGGEGSGEPAEGGEKQVAPSGEEHGEHSEKTELREEREENHLKSNDSTGCGGKAAEPHVDSANVAALKEQLAAVQAELATVRGMIPKEMPEEERSMFVTAQARAERVAQAYGDAAPRWLQGEQLAQYRRRLARPFQRYSKAWKDIDLTTLPDTALEVAETQIYADAWGEATKPTPASAGGGLRKVTEVDGETGRRITRFYGDPHAWLDQFQNPDRHLSKVNINRR